MPRVLVTRPAPLAFRTARRLEKMFFEPVVLPLSETRRIDADPWRIPANAGSVAVTSANAIRHASGELLRELAGLPCHAVGGATAAAARAAGFRQVIDGPGDAAGLSRMLAASAAAPVVYLCGRVRRPDFEAALAAAGMEVTAVMTYDTVDIRPDVGQASAAIGREPLAAALVYSANAAHGLAELAAHPEIAGCFRETAFCCLSRRIAAGLMRDTAWKILVAAEPTEEALLSLLAKPA